jgi:CheY-like chemotaxis protein
MTDVLKKSKTYPVFNSLAYSGLQFNSQLYSFSELKKDTVYSNILLIDDDEDDREIFISAVTDAAPNVKSTTMADAADALEQLIKKELTPDLIFLDLNIPRMNGQQFLMEIKKHQSIQHIPVIILSTTSHATTIEIVRELGAHAFITKPGIYDDLVTLLKSLLN